MSSVGGGQSFEKYLVATMAFSFHLMWWIFMTFLSAKCTNEQNKRRNKRTKEQTNEERKERIDQQANEWTMNWLLRMNEWTDGRTNERETTEQWINNEQTNEQTDRQTNEQTTNQWARNERANSHPISWLFSNIHSLSLVALPGPAGLPRPNWQTYLINLDSTGRQRN